MQAPKRVPSWCPGDIARAKLSCGDWEPVRIARDENGDYYKEMTLALSPRFVTAMCFHCVVLKTENPEWFPESSMKLALRPRPLYFPKKEPKVEKVGPTPQPARQPRKIRVDHQIPMTVAQPTTNSRPDSNVQYVYQNTPKSSKTYNEYTEFLRRGKRRILDGLYREENGKRIKNLEFPKVNEVELHLSQCYQYNQTFKAKLTTTTYDSEESNDSDDCVVVKPLSVHVTWCIVCSDKSGSKDLIKCTNCPAAFHDKCREAWPYRIYHRKNLAPQLMALGQVNNRGSGPSPSCICPCCVVGPQLGYGDIVWNKLGTFSWWPARVLEPGSLPACLLARGHLPTDLPLAYYGEDENFAWCDRSRVCIFIPQHYDVLADHASKVGRAVTAACDDYIVRYLP